MVNFELMPALEHFGLSVREKLIRFSGERQSGAARFNQVSTRSSWRVCSANREEVVCAFVLEQYKEVS